MDLYVKLVVGRGEIFNEVTQLLIVLSLEVEAYFVLDSVGAVILLDPREAVFGSLSHLVKDVRGFVF